MHLEGIYVRKDHEKALDYFIKGAARDNAFCFFELSRLYSEGTIVAKNEKLSFEYMKRSAEEGFTSAQHLVGIDYFQGVRCPKDDQLSLAWFR